MHGMTCAQVFVTIEGFINEYPLRNNGYTYDSQNKMSPSKIKLP